MVANWPKSRLFDIIHQSALLGPDREGGIPVYTSDSLSFGSRYTAKEVSGLGGYEYPITVCVKWDDDVCIDERDSVMMVPLDPARIKKFRIMEDWVFDNEHSDFRPHIVAIAPLYEQLTAGGALPEMPLYWVMMKDLKPILATKQVFNPYNDMKDISYNDWFQKRLFHSYVVGESNLYDADFKYMEAYEDDPMEQLLQGERVEEELFNREHDFWEY